MGGNPIRYSSTADFRSFIYNNGLMDLGYVGDQFTWSNMLREGHEIKERLDRALCSVRWKETFEDARVFHENRVGSDHRPIFIDLYASQNKATAPFRFDVRCLRREECALIIRDNWPTNCLITDNLKECASRLKDWSYTDYSQAKALEVELQARLDYLANVNRDQDIIDEKASTLN
ncbi:hypothetical protein LINGRAHAP2_LOCUS23096 [Linum grandiflorum]